MRILRQICKDPFIGGDDDVRIDLDNLTTKPAKSVTKKSVRSPSSSTSRKATTSTSASASALTRSSASSAATASPTSPSACPTRKRPSPAAHSSNNEAHKQPRRVEPHLVQNAVQSSPAVIDGAVDARRAQLKDMSREDLVDLVLGHEFPPELEPSCDLENRKKDAKVMLGKLERFNLVAKKKSVTTKSSRIRDMSVILDNMTVALSTGQDFVDLGLVSLRENRTRALWRLLRPVLSARNRSGTPCPARTR